MFSGSSACTISMPIKYLVVLQNNACISIMIFWTLSSLQVHFCSPHWFRSLIIFSYFLWTIQLITIHLTNVETKWKTKCLMVFLMNIFVLNNKYNSLHAGCNSFFRFAPWQKTIANSFNAHIKHLESCKKYIKVSLLQKRCFLSIQIAWQYQDFESDSSAWIFFVRPFTTQLILSFIWSSSFLLQTFNQENLKLFRVTEKWDGYLLFHSSGHRCKEFCLPTYSNFIPPVTDE